MPRSLLRFAVLAGPLTLPALAGCAPVGLIDQALGLFGHSSPTASVNPTSTDSGSPSIVSQVSGLFGQPSPTASINPTSANPISANGSNSSAVSQVAGLFGHPSPAASVTTASVGTTSVSTDSLNTASLQAADLQTANLNTASVNTASGPEKEVLLAAIVKTNDQVMLSSAVQLGADLTQPSALTWYDPDHLLVVNQASYGPQLEEVPADGDRSSYQGIEPEMTSIAAAGPHNGLFVGLQTGHLARSVGLGELWSPFAEGHAATYPG